MGGLLSNIFHKNACVIRKNAFKVWIIFSFVYFSKTNVNTKVLVADSIFICGHCSNSRTAYFCELVIIKVEATYYLQILDIVPTLVVLYNVRTVLFLVLNLLWDHHDCTDKSPLTNSRYSLLLYKTFNTWPGQSREVD